MKICIVSSCGGHLTEVRQLLSVYREYSYFYVLNDQIDLVDEMQEKTYFILHSERDWKVFINFFEAARILFKHRPKVVLSTGAGPVVPFAILARTIFPARVIYIETLARVNSPSLTGRVMYWLAHDFYFQWPTLKTFFPRGRCVGMLL